MHIYLNLVDETKEVRDVQFHYTKADGWQVGAGQAMPTMEAAEPQSNASMPAFEEHFNDEPSEEQIQGLFGNQAPWDEYEEED